MRRARGLLPSAGVAVLSLLLAVQPAAAVTWASTMDLSPAGDEVNAWRSDIAASAGRVFMAYVDKHVAWVRSSTDGGATFAPAIQVSDGATSATRASVAAGSGTGYVTWTETPQGGTPRVWLRRSTDGGATWSSATPLTPSGSPAIAGGQLFAVSARVFFAYVDDTADRVLLRRSTTSGLSFGPPVVLGTSRTSGPVSMAFGDSVMYVAWESSLGSVRLRRSTTGGISWSDARTLQVSGSAVGPAARPWLAARGSRALIAMATGPGIVVRTTSDRGVTWQGGVRVTGSIEDPTLAVTRSATGWWLVYDTCGRGGDCDAMNVRVRTSIDGRTWSAPTTIASGGSIRIVGAAYSATDGRTWVSWQQETALLSATWIVRARSGR